MNEERSDYGGTMDERPVREAAPYGEPGPRGTGDPRTGWTPTPAQPGPRKSPALACFLSCMPGLGQIYVGYYLRGFVHVITVAAVITLLSSGDVRGLEPLLGLFLAFFWLYNMVDAARRASAYNRMAAGGHTDALPELTDQVGGKFTGAMLVAFGILLLFHTLLGFDFDWLEEWWPLGIIGFGVYILWRNRQASDAR